MQADQSTVEYQMSKKKIYFIQKYSKHINQLNHDENAKNQKNSPEICFRFFNQNLLVLLISGLIWDLDKFSFNAIFSFSFIYFALITLIPIALSIQAFIMCSWNSGRADPGLLGFYMECNNWPHFKRQHFAAFSCLNATKYGLNTTEHKLHLNALNCSNLWFSLPSSVYMFFCFLESFSLTLSMKAIVLLCL